MVRFCTLFNAENHTVTFLNGQTYPLSSLRALGMGSLLDAMFEFSEKLGSLGLEPDEMALFMAVVLVSAGRQETLFIDKCCTRVMHHSDIYVSRSHWHLLCPADRTGISDMRAVEQLQESLIRALRSLITRHRPDDTALFPKLLLRLPDLRTLNNLHSDKLLAFRIDPWTRKLTWASYRHTDNFQKRDIFKTSGAWNCAIRGMWIRVWKTTFFEQSLIFLHRSGIKNHPDTS